MILSELYKKDNYLNKNIDFLINKVIIEYDLKSANTSLCREYQLLPEEKISEIELMSKKDRVTTIGKLMRKDSDFKEGLKDAFSDIRKRFFDENDIEDGDILAIKKDAIFCLKEVSNTQFGHCRFVDKNRYTSYMYLNKLELFYAPVRTLMDNDGVLDIKGIDDDILSKHNDYMIKTLKMIFKHLETSSKDTLFGYINRFITKYKMRKLDTGYYREFNQESVFRVMDSNETYDDEVFIPYDNKSEVVDIDYNFFNILIPILKIVV